MLKLRAEVAFCVVTMDLVVPSLNAECLVGDRSQQSESRTQTRKILTEYAEAE
jgi:hypothetical protein